MRHTNEWQTEKKNREKQRYQHLYHYGIVGECADQSKSMEGISGAFRDFTPAIRIPRRATPVRISKSVWQPYPVLNHNWYSYVVSRKAIGVEQLDRPKGCL
jgi:hypothetical protein